MEPVLSQFHQTSKYELREFVESGYKNSSVLLFHKGKLNDIEFIGYESGLTKLFFHSHIKVDLSHIRKKKKSLSHRKSQLAHTKIIFSLVIFGRKFSLFERFILVNKSPT